MSVPSSLVDIPAPKGMALEDVCGVGGRGGIRQMVKSGSRGSGVYQWAPKGSLENHCPFLQMARGGRIALIRHQT